MNIEFADLRLAVALEEVAFEDFNCRRSGDLVAFGALLLVELNVRALPKTIIKAKRQT